MKSASKRFEPHGRGGPKNATVEFPNADPIYHNVFSVSGGNRFDLGLYRSGASKSKKFEEAGLVRVYCNIHPQMVGFVMVVDSGVRRASRARTARSASRTFPPATHTLKAWHEEGAETSQPITVKASGERRFSFGSTSRARRPSRTRTSTARTTSRRPATPKMSATEAHARRRHLGASCASRASSCRRRRRPASR